MQHHSRFAILAAIFALAIRSKRDLLQTLFYSVKNNAAEAWSLHQQLMRIEKPRAGGTVTYNTGDVIPRHELINAKAAVETTAQDSAMALMLIIDYALRRFGQEASIDTRTLGSDFAQWPETQQNHMGVN